MTDEHARESSPQPTRETATGGASRAALEYGWASPALRKTLNQLRIESADVERKLSLHGGSASSFAEQEKKAAIEKAGVVPMAAAEVSALINSVHQLEDKTDNRYSERAKWIGAGLYVLGWGLGLFGKFLGVPDAAAGS